MKERSRHIPSKVKLAAALLLHMRDDGTGRLVRTISHAEARTLTAEQIIARFHLDHYPIRFADGGPHEPWNVSPRPVAEHRHKTAKVDIPAIAKSKRLHKAHEDFKRRLLAKSGQIPVEVRGDLADAPARKPKRAWPKRPFPSRVDLGDRVRKRGA